MPGYVLKNTVKYLLLKIKWRGKLSCKYPANISFSSTFEGMNRLGRNVRFHGSLGYGSYISEGSNISADIGRFCSIAHDVYTIEGTHPYTYPYATTAPCFISPLYSKEQSGGCFATYDVGFNQFRFADEAKKVAVHIGNDVWIGTRATIIGGIRICDGAVILAGAVVTKDVPPYAIVAGVPAKVIGYRYSDADIDRLENIKWWDNSIDWFKSNWYMLNDMENLIRYYKKGRE